MRADGGGDKIGDAGGWHAHGPDQDHTLGNAFLPKDQLAKVPVIREQHGALTVCHIQYRLIGYAWRHLLDVAHVMALLPQALDNGALHVLIGDENHETSTNGYARSDSKTSAAKAKAALTSSRLR